MMRGLSLEPIDRELLDGGCGPAAAAAMRMLKRYGEALEADRFVSIHSAHIDGCLYHGPSSIDFAQRFVDCGARVRVPTTLNVAVVDVVHPGWHQGDPAILAEQRRLTELHERMGCLATLTCAPYQRMVQPLAGEHVAWAESNAIVFVNSVLGARTDRYGDFTDLCAALTGRVPYVGLHRPENRRATLIVEVPDRDANDMPADLYFACLGYVLGKGAIGHVPAIVGLAAASRDELKALGTAGDEAALPTLRIEGADLDSALATLCPLDLGEPLAALCLGTPHFSMSEFERLARAVAGQPAAAAVEVYVSTLREIEVLARDRSRGSRPCRPRLPVRLRCGDRRRHLHLSRPGGTRAARGDCHQLRQMGALCAGQPRAAGRPDGSRSLPALGGGRGGGAMIDAALRVLVGGTAAGPVAALSAPLSLWGGFDLDSGRICDASHPQHGLALAGTILVMPGARGSSSSSSALVEAVRRGTAPRAIILSRVDPILVIGALVAADLYSVDLPILLTDDAGRAAFASGERFVIAASREGLQVGRI